MVLLLTFVMLASLMALMSVGVLLGGKRLKGSCGGRGAECACDEAGRPRACEAGPGRGDLSAPPLSQLPAPGQHGQSRRGAASMGPA